MAETDMAGQMELLISGEILIALWGDKIKDAFKHMLLAAEMQNEEGKVALQLEYQGYWTLEKLKVKGHDVFPDFRFENKTLWLIEPLPNGHVTREEFVHFGDGLYISLMAHNEYGLPGEMLAKAVIIRD